MYLHLFHGRSDPAQQMNDWGFDGPTFGPTGGVQVTSACHIQLMVGDAMLVLRVDGSMVYYDGEWYGGWVVLPEAPGAVVEYDDAKSYPPLKDEDAEEG